MHVDQILGWSLNFKLMTVGFSDLESTSCARKTKKCLILSVSLGFDPKTLRKIETGYCSFGEDSKRIMYAHKRWKNGIAS